MDLIKGAVGHVDLLKMEIVFYKFKVEVQVHGEDEWCGNGLTFNTRAKAEEYAKDLASRWTRVREWRVVEVAP